jgi:hypothetical protein
MLTIRQAQMQVFEREARSQFAARLVPHLRKFWCEPCAGLSDAQIQERAWRAVETAMALGFDLEFDVGRFVDLCFLFGEDFPAGKAAGWAPAVLEDRSGSPTERMDRLWKRARLALAEPDASSAGSGGNRK